MRIALLALALAGCGGTFTSAIPYDDAGARHDAPIEARHEAGSDVIHRDSKPAKDAMPEADLAETTTKDVGADHHDAAPPPPDAPTPDVAPPPPDSPPPPKDSGCAPPSETSGVCGGIPYTIPYQFCAYDGYTYTYSVLDTPPECQCAVTYDCTCLGWYPGSVCGPLGSFSACSGTPPQVTCD